MEGLDFPDGWHSDAQEDWQLRHDVQNLWRGSVSYGYCSGMVGVIVLIYLKGGRLC